MTFTHERVVIETGRRSGQTIIVAVHSTALGTAVGGCRMWHYDSVADGLSDALRLSEAMTLKCAAAELPLGGGKSVIALQPGTSLDAEQRRQVFLDLGDVVDSFGGSYKTGEDVGTSADDMWIARERTEHALCLPPAHGGSGEPSEPTAVGTFAAIGAVARQVFGKDDLAGLRCTVVGLGQVGGRLATRLAERGAVLTVADIVESRRDLADALGARWLSPEDAMLAEADVLVPAALGGVLTPEIVPALRCRAIVGPANNQLSDPAVADRLAEAGIVWAPDFVVNAGGAVHGAHVDLGGRSIEFALEQAALIGPRIEQILVCAAADAITPYDAALRLARARITTAPARVPA